LEIDPILEPRSGGDVAGLLRSFEDRAGLLLVAVLNPFFSKIKPLGDFSMIEPALWEVLDVTSYYSSFWDGFSLRGTFFTGNPISTS